MSGEKQLEKTEQTYPRREDIERCRRYLERIPKPSRDAWVAAAYEVYLAQKLDATDPER
jgi:hypothetical protein